MTDSNHSLVPADYGQLAPAATPSEGVLSALVRQTLSLAGEPAVTADVPTVLFADWDGDFIDLIEAQWQALRPGAPLTFLRCGEAHEIVELAARGRFDLAIITLNNVFGIGPGVAARIAVMLKIVRQLKDAYEKPIVALSGHYDSDDLPERALAAGADVFRDRDDTQDLANLIQLYLERKRSPST